MDGLSLFDVEAEDSVPKCRSSSYGEKLFIELRGKLFPCEYGSDREFVVPVLGLIVKGEREES